MNTDIRLHNWDAFMFEELLLEREDDEEETTATTTVEDKWWDRDTTPFGGSL